MMCVHLTLEILEAAAATNVSIERVVITSSVAGIISPMAFGGSEPQDPDHPFTSSSRVPLMKPPFAHPSIAYIASKVASLEVTETWAKETNPGFGIVNIHLSWVLGPTAWAGEEYEVLLKKGNRLVLNTIVQGNKSPFPHMTRAIVRGCRSFIASTPGAWEDIPGIVRKNFVEELQSEPKRVTVLGEQTSIPLGIESSDTVVAFGWKFTDLEQTITDLISQYIELK
ncbi:NAD(P)-binding protein [Penicillium samsonianum]|uniref:NAD(P)-binding protein n=1 Tax=Penicillium samsonianum TaxID=1882272 RepID=UPI0025466C49|nr:NAD(P)-binding protein [Penicillium samsonianum]KAJ6138468.1 NAD(P)-binding protein [Penicillium samsonianum]